MEHVIIDTDAGDDIDDAIAIAFAARRPELNLLAVTTVTYDAHRRAALVRQVLDAVGRQDVAVAAGAQFPLKPMTAEERTHFMREARMNHCPPASAPGGVDVAGADDAVALMARLIESHPGEVTLIGIGPVTNLATLLVRRPDLAPKIKAVALMGGEVALPRGEHNMMSDDAAAAQLFAWRLPMFLGTWSVTRQVVLMPEDMRTIAARGTPIAELLAACNRRWAPVQSWKPGPVMYDLAPILWTFRPDLFTTRAMSIGIETTGTLTRGWTVPTSGEPHVAVTEAMDAAAAKRMLMETLLQ